MSRYRLIDRAALIQALAAGRLSGFGLDTFYDEPGHAHDPLLGFRNVLITPHVAGSVRGLLRRAYALAGAQVRRFAAGEPLINVVVDGY